ncbi:MAG: hypothetical protein JKY42_09590 [Flavobacteriales bacterium]|nr:hypothetical protein [Flavobacteriales bacterium]
MAITKHILSCFIILVLSINIEAWGQEKTETPPKEPEKAETPKKSSPEGKEDQRDAPRVKSPIEIATRLCVDAESQKKLGKHDEAIKTYTEALENLPEHYPAFVGRAGAKFLKLDFQGALADYDAAIEMMEALKEKHETQAKIKKVFGDVTGEKIELDYANGILPALADTYYQRGNVKQFMDDKASACDDIKKAKELGHLHTDDAIKSICGS